MKDRRQAGRRRRTTAVTVALLTVVCTAYVALTLPTWWPGLTPESTASILVHDRKFGFRALARSKSYGDAILPPLIRESADFARVDNRSAFWISDLLADSTSSRSKQILLDLYERNDSPLGLVGAIGLARRDALPGRDLALAFLGQEIRAQEWNGWADADTRRGLAAIALGDIADDRSAQLLIEALRAEQRQYWVSARVADSLGKLGDPAAIEPLLDALQSPNFYALPHAFDALIALGERRAVGAAVTRVSPSLRGRNSGDVVRRLQRVTGQRFGFNGDKWRAWWGANKEAWQLDGAPSTSLREDARK